MIKKAWITSEGRDNDYHTFCIRFDQWDEHVPQLVANKNVFPPSGMNIDEAKKQGKAEEHWVVTGFHTEDLITLRDAIDKLLIERQRS